MILYKCRFGTLWVTTLVLCYHFLVVGGQALGSWAGGNCFLRCLIPRCPGLETDCVCSEFRAALEVADGWDCALRTCPPAAVMAGFAVLENRCRPSISTATSSSRAGFSTTIVFPSPTSSPTAARTTARNIISTLTSTRPTGAPSSPSSSTSSSSTSSTSRPSCPTSSSSTSSGCATSTSVMNPSTAPPAPTPTTTTEEVDRPTSPTGGPSPSGTTPPPPLGDRPVEQRRINSGLIVASVLGPLGFLMSLLAIFLILRRRQGRNRRSIMSFTGISDFDANRGNITAPLAVFSPAPPRVPLADINTRPTARGSQMSAGVGARAMTAVAATRREPVRREPVRGEPVRGEPVRREPVRREPGRREPVLREYTAAATPASGPSRSNSQLYIFPPTNRRLPVTRRQPQGQQHSDLTRSLKKPLPQLPRPPEEAVIRPRAGPSTGGSPLTLPSTVYPVAETPRPMSAISESEEADLYQPIPDDTTEAEFRRVYHDVRRALNRSPSTSTDQNSTDWSNMTDLSRNSTTRSFRPER